MKSHLAVVFCIVLSAVSSYAGKTDVPSLASACNSSMVGWPESPSTSKLEPATENSPVKVESDWLADDLEEVAALFAALDADGVGKEVWNRNTSEEKDPVMSRNTWTLYELSRFMETNKYNASKMFPSQGLQDYLHALAPSSLMRGKRKRVRRISIRSHKVATSKSVARLLKVTPLAYFYPKDKAEQKKVALDILTLFKIYGTEHFVGHGDILVQHFSKIFEVLDPLELGQDRYKFLGVLDSLSRLSLRPPSSWVEPVNEWVWARKKDFPVLSLAVVYMNMAMAGLKPADKIRNYTFKRFRNLSSGKSATAPFFFRAMAQALQPADSSKEDFVKLHQEMGRYHFSVEKQLAVKIFYLDAVHARHYLSAKDVPAVHGPLMSGQDYQSRRNVELEELIQDSLRIIFPNQEVVPAEKIVPLLGRARLFLPQQKLIVETTNITHNTYFVTEVDDTISVTVSSENHFDILKRAVYEGKGFGYVQIPHAVLKESSENIDSVMKDYFPQRLKSDSEAELDRIETEKIALDPEQVEQQLRELLGEDTNSGDSQ